MSNGDAPKSQHVTEVSFVDENGKHVDIGGGGTTEIHTDATLAGTGTTDNPLKLSDDTNSKIAKAGTITEDNLEFKNNVTLSDVTPVGVHKDSSGNLSILYRNNRGLAKVTLSGGITALSVPAIPALAAISKLDSSAGLTDVINKVNEILNAVKQAS
jgi:hypothetical protein